VLAMMLSLARQLGRLDHAVRNQNYQIRYQNLSRDLHGKTLGLLGFGRIGFRVATACQTLFNMRVLACDPCLPVEVRERYVELATFVDKAQLCRDSDIISVHVPLTRETRHALSAAEFALMKSDAILINTSRGPVIDEEALVEALQNNDIGGAGLDVQDQEPPRPDNPLLKLDNVLLTPHSAALTKECVIRMATDAADRTIEVLADIKPINVANPEVLALHKWRHLKEK
jgi:D-3-phosphoglycerate dehydrogenase